jgi:hypothetical protein
VFYACSRSAADSTRNRADSSPAVSAPTPLSADHPAAGVATAGPIVPVSGPSTAASAGPCPRTGLWAECSVEKRLTQAGFVVQRAGAPGPVRPGFSVAPRVYNLGKSRLEVFIYPNEAAVRADVSKIDTASAAPKGKAGQWPLPPTFVRSANLIAVFLTDNPTQAERLTLALTAGAPQP